MNFKPIKTEYKGITFRSKSEAIFARCLDMRSSRHMQLWTYEPSWIVTSDGWTPDFLVWLKRGNDTAQFIIEYKPSTPTESYIGLLEGRFKEIQENAMFLPTTFYLMVTGNYWSDDKFVYEYTNGKLESISNGWRSLGIPGEIIKEAKNYRFDLKAEL